MVHVTAPGPALPSGPEGPAAPLLLAEDNPVNAKVAVAMLENAGYRVVTVVNGVEAVAAVAGGRYAAVLMDCQMPTMDGYEATERIRAGERSGLHTPIIAMTAGNGSEDRRRCFSVGMDDYLAKPVQREHLLSTLSRWTGPRDGGTQGCLVMPLPTSGEVLDADTMADLRSLGSEPGSAGLLEELFQLFFTEMTRRIADLHEALRRADSHSVASAAHLLKGSAAEIGARRLAIVCSDLVTMGVAGRLEGAETVLVELKEEYDLVRAALRAQNHVENSDIAAAREPHRAHSLSGAHETVATDLWALARSTRG
ncbi:MAG TPA: response regulator [Acidimicrobiales bacterium]|jgi:CheY-like chemotaxis protein/HPt (histidine-containing phosphotransfer) domain-containing protein|nr:response regulator [Acidimicrobiales bacterium]